MKINEIEYLNTKEVCELIGVSMPTLLKKIKTGDIKAIKYNGMWLLKGEWVEAYLKDVLDFKD